MSDNERPVAKSLMSRVNRLDDEEIQRLSDIAYGMGLVKEMKAIPPEAEKTALAYLQGMAAMAAANAEKKEETLK